MKYLGKSITFCTTQQRLSIFIYVFCFHSKVEMHLGRKNLVISLSMTIFYIRLAFLKVLWTHFGGWNIYNSYSNHCQPSGSIHSNWQKQSCVMHFWYVMIPYRMNSVPVDCFHAHTLPRQWLHHLGSACFSRSQSWKCLLFLHFLSRVTDHWWTL